MTLLRVVRPDSIQSAELAPIREEVARVAAEIVADIRANGEAALRRHAARLGDIADRSAPLLVDADDLAIARDTLPRETRELLERTARSIRAFADAQRATLTECAVPIPGGVARQEIAPVEAAGCYAPGGRFPLPSSVLMTAVTAGAAGVDRVLVASPRPHPITLGAAAIAGADALLCVGGAQAIAAMAFGVPGVLAPCDAIVGPGNAYVTAAKQLVAGFVRIDMLAGPSELAVLADDSADAATLAADLLAQAEHDPNARPILVTTSRELADQVEVELAAQLATLPTGDIARAACRNGFVCMVESLEQGVAVIDTLAPEHLEVHTRDAAAVAASIRHYGAVFVGAATAEVLGDYGIGPNHTLPTGRTARSFGGLSVFDFLRIRTTLQIDRREEAVAAVRDAAALARLEGLEGHARSAERRL
ncbi:MAG: histidinol dehydrogenase [Phycisphaerales bacterium]